jgi:5-methylcytosine-specific restriction endonuclease McrA
MTPEHRTAISEALTGRTLSPEHIAKISGENNYRYRGVGKRNLSKKEWRAMREVVLRRDGYACLWCGNNNLRSLVVHHIVEYWDGGPDSPENLLTLCRSCHVRHHSHQSDLDR